MKALTDRHKTWRLEGAAGLDAAAAVLGMVRSEMGSTARGAGRSGAQHAMAVNETIAAFVLGGSVPGAAGGVGTVRSWSTETEFLLPSGRRKVRPDGVWQAPEIGVPVLMVEVDRSTMAPADVAAKFPRYRELFRARVRDNGPARSGESADRTVHWWRRAWPGHTRPGYPPVALVVTGAGPVALANRQQAVADLSADCWCGRWCRAVRDYNDDGWREYDDALPVIATTLHWPSTGRSAPSGGATAAQAGTASSRRWRTRTTGPPTTCARLPARTSSTRPIRS